MRIGTQAAGAVGTLLLTLASHVSAQQIFVNQTASYQYVNATAATTIGSVPANWFAVGFDDSKWFTGSGPFANTDPGLTIFDDLKCERTVCTWSNGIRFPASRTQWDVDEDPDLRTYFTLLAPQDLTIWIAVDNGIGQVGAANAGLFLNGVQTSNSINAEGNAFRWEIVFNVPPPTPSRDKTSSRYSSKIMAA